MTGPAINKDTWFSIPLHYFRTVSLFKRTLDGWVSSFTGIVSLMAVRAAEQQRQSVPQVDYSNCEFARVYINS